MRNYKTQSEYNLHSSGLRVLRNRAGVLFSTLPKGHAIVSDVNGGEFYGIESGKYYPTKLLLRLNRLIQTEGKYDWIQWHSTYDGLDYHVSQVCSKDYRWVNGIDSLPENATVTLDPVIIEDPEITGRQDATTDDYWDCECREDYINKKSEKEYCGWCNTNMEDQPDSRVSEVNSSLNWGRIG